MKGQKGIFQADEQAERSGCGCTSKVVQGMTATPGPEEMRVGRIGSAGAQEN